MTIERTQIFRVTNHHGESCGASPEIDGDDKGYHGYFENEHGEQWLFWYDTDLEEGWIWGGDIGWGKRRAFADHSLILNSDELAWVQACMKAALAFKATRISMRQKR